MLTIEKDVSVDEIYHLMVIHSNLKKYTHLYRALYTKRLGRSRVEK